MVIKSHKLGKDICSAHNKGYVCRIYNTLTNQKEKKGKDVHRHFTEDEAHMANKHVKRDISHPPE